MKASTSNLHLEILDPKRFELLGELSRLASPGVLGGGTAMALLLGHRLSYDFDIFFPDRLPPRLEQKVHAQYKEHDVELLRHDAEELTLSCDGVKLTFMVYPFAPLHPVIRTEFLPLFDLADLASNKAYTIGRRATWRDYVDLAIALESGLALGIIIQEASARFGSAFSEKLFLEQLTYFDDIHDFAVEYVIKSYAVAGIQQILRAEVERYLERRIG